MKLNMAAKEEERSLYFYSSRFYLSGCNLWLSFDLQSDFEF